MCFYSLSKVAITQAIGLEAGAATGATGAATAVSGQSEVLTHDGYGNIVDRVIRSVRAILR